MLTWEARQRKLLQKTTIKDCCSLISLATSYFTPDCFGFSLRMQKRRLQFTFREQEHYDAVCVDFKQGTNCYSN